MGGIKIKNDIDDSVRKDAEKISETLGQNSSRINAVIGGGKDKIKITIIDGTVDSTFFNIIQNSNKFGNSNNINFRQKEIYISRNY